MSRIFPYTSARSTTLEAWEFGQKKAHRWPEGGFTESEVAPAREHGFLPVSIGPRILRTETAAIVGAGLVQYQLGNMA